MVIEKLKQNGFRPYYLEQAARHGDFENFEDILDRDEMRDFFLLNEDEFYENIQKVYFPTTPKLPDNIVRAIKDALEQTSYNPWALVTDWLAGTSDYDFDKVMVGYIQNSDDKAQDVYGYMLNLVI